MIYLTEPVDEYCIQALPEFDGKRFQNVAKEGVKFDESEKTKESREATEKEFEPLLNWMKDKALKDKVFFWKLEIVKILAPDFLKNCFVNKLNFATDCFVTIKTCRDIYTVIKLLEG